MKIMLRLATIAMPMLLAAAANPAPAPGGEVSLQIEMNQDTPENALWFGYLTSRAAYIDTHRAAYEGKRGVVAPLFAEELAARTDVVRLYRELKQKDGKLDVVYFDDLARVADHSFMGEYVWTYLYQPDWGTPPDDLHLVDFMTWRATNLAQHIAVTRGDIRFAAKSGTPEQASQEFSSGMPIMSRGVEVLRHGNPQLAIAGYFDPVIEHFEKLQRGSGTRFFAARNQQQVILYAAMPDDEKKPVEVLDATWSDAYLLKAYSQIELRKLPDAETALERAISLSPLSSQYFSELAYIYQSQGQCERSIATYQQAESAANMGSDDSTKTADLTLAWRGQGYCLVELGRFDEAERLYKKCLKLDPSDSKAKGELEYVKSKRH